MPRIVVQKIDFDKNNKFRKLKNLTISLAPRITIIAGHNGIGKSTILALLAHPSGLTNRQYKTFFDRTFQANFNEIIHIDFNGDYKSKLGPPKTLSEPSVTYLINSTESVTKACRLGPRGDDAARVVARSIKPSTKKFTSSDGKVTIGPAQKVPLPTLYLGMTRVLPIGEAPVGSATSASLKMDIEDSKLISDFFNQVIPGSNTSAESVTLQRIKDTGKISGQPKHTFDPRCVSVGQDSLGSIALALASFNSLKRKWPAYPGGLLIIDELDAGLHPHAIGGLVKQLKSLAKKLDLQIVATTHSQKLIEAVHPESEPLNTSPLDSVIYIRDTSSPRVLLNPTLRQINSDMNLEPPGINSMPPPVVKIYFEDDEAAAMFNAIINSNKLQEIGSKNGVTLEPLPLGLGCEHLARLADHDPYFKEVVIVVDADASVNKANGKNKHIAQLPGDMYKAPLLGNENPAIIKKPLAPERTLLQYVLGIVNSPDEHAATLGRLDAKDVTTDQLREHILDGATKVLSNRDQTKAWWKAKSQFIEDWGLLREWVVDRPTECLEFERALDSAVATVAKRVLGQTRQATL